MLTAGGDSAEWHRDLLEAAPVPIAVYGPDGALRYVNDAAVAFVEADDRAALLGRRAVEFVHPDDRETIGGRLERVLEARETVPPVEARFLSSSGAPKHAIVSGGPVTHEGDAAGQAILNDISERKRRERQLRRERDRFEVLFENLPCAVVHGVAREGEPIVRRVNRRFEEVFGWTQEEIAGENLDEYIVPDGGEADAERLDRQILSEGRVQTEVRRETDDGVRDFLHQVVLRDGSADAPEGYAIYVDITDKRETERKLRRQNERLEEFASMVAHDLRNPLNAAMLSTETLRDGGGSDELEQIGRAHERMDRIIGDLLALANQCEPAVDPGPVDVATLAERAWATVKNPRADLDIRDTRRIEADSDQLLELFDNLFQNAIDHAGETATVEVGCLEDGFYVADDGPGIPPGRREDVFDSGVSTTQEGTGLGLTIVRRIVEAHGWEIRISESEAGGTRVEIGGVEAAT